jgi:hypothetical protein
MASHSPDQRAEDADKVMGGGKPWSAPVLTVQSVEEVTRGVLDSTLQDGGNFFS